MPTRSEASAFAAAYPVTDGMVGVIAPTEPVVTSDPPSTPQPSASTRLSTLVPKLEQKAQLGDRMAELVLELGDVERAVPRPAGMRRGRRGYCFANAERRACPIDEKQPRYLYVEGYALNAAGLRVVRAPAYLDPEAGEHRVVLVSGA